jgi:hypothetical protein
MATESDPTPPDGAKDVVQSGDNDENFELSPGEEIVARIVTIQPVESEWGESAILTLETEDGDFVDYFAKDEVKRAYRQDNLERGATYWIAKMSSTEEVNGNEFHPTKLKQIE